jgi:Cys-tRNA(Pro)/Cys-tRNA(Cys) deacylase
MSEQAQAKQDEARLVEWARQRGLDVRLHDDLPLVKTVAQAAQALGVSPAQIAKSVVFMAEDRAVVVLAPGDAKVVDRLVVDHVGGVRNRFRLARPAEVLEATGYPVGGVPPFGYPRPVRTLIESRLLENDRVIFGGGSDRALLEVAPDDVKRVTKAEPGTFTA